MNKYKNKKTIMDDIKFDSMLEARAYQYLSMRQDIVILELQPEFELQPKFKSKGKTIRAIKYIADFKIAYKQKEYIIDAKGMETPAFKIKFKMLLYKYPEINFLVFKSIKQFSTLLENS